MNFNTPILFLVFNRPEYTKQVFEAIRCIKPKQLFIAADGERSYVPEDKENCRLVKEIVSNVDWDCEVKTLYRQANLGCGLAVSSAITWFFEHVEMGIILEDDILPEPNFFHFCEEMLVKYKDNKDILSVSGFNFGYNPEQVFVSNYMNMWGWATWRRSARAIDYQLTTWRSMNFLQKKFFLLKILNRELKFNYKWINYWYNQFNSIFNHEDIHTWDYQWIYHGLSSNKKIIYSNINYIKNIGFGINATHTIDENNIAASINSSNKRYGNIVNLTPDKVFEKDFIKVFYAQSMETNKISFLIKLKNRLKYYFYRVFPELNALTTNNQILSKSYKGINTKLNPPFRITNSYIGNYTYIAEGAKINKTIMGKYCSIGPNLISGWGIHPTNGFSTHPMFYSTMKQNGMTLAKEDKIQELIQINIGNDVFIGMNVVILDGVTIGNGAIIGAGAVVSKDIPDYAIAVGNPIQVIKYRFNEEIRKKLIELEWWNISDDILPLIEENFWDIEKLIETLETIKESG